MAVKTHHAYAPLSPDRAFVVQLRQQEAVISPENLSGRVEHISSGRATSFASLQQLYAFLGQLAVEDAVASGRSR